MTGSKVKKLAIVSSDQRSFLREVLQQAPQTAQFRFELFTLALAFTGSGESCLFAKFWEESFPLLLGIFRESLETLEAVDCLAAILQESPKCRNLCVECGVGTDLIERFCAGVFSFPVAVSACQVLALLLKGGVPAIAIEAAQVQRLIHRTVDLLPLAAESVPIQHAIELLRCAVQHFGSAKAFVLEQHPKVIDWLSQVCRQHQQRLQMLPDQRRIAAACCLAILLAGGKADFAATLRTVVIPALIRSLSLEEDQGDILFVPKSESQRVAQSSSLQVVRAKAAVALAFLTADNHELQRVAYEARAVPYLASLLLVADRCPLLTEHVLLALGSCCAFYEAARNQLLENRASLVEIYHCLQPAQPPSVKTAACVCLRSLSRSPKALRTALLDLEVGEPLVELLEDGCDATRLAAVAALCNLLLDYSPFRDWLLQDSQLKRICRKVDACTEPVVAVRVNGWWALKNVAYLAPSTAKTALLLAVGKETIEAALLREDPAVRIQALNFVRNVACTTSHDVDYAVVVIGEDTLVAAFASAFAQPGDDAIVEQAVFCLVNIFASSQAHKRLAMAPLPSGKPIVFWIAHSLLVHENTEIRRGAAWCLANASAAGDAANSADPTIEAMRTLGIEDQLRKAIATEPDPSVQEIATAALLNFENY